MTLIVLSEGGEIPMHHTEGPMTLHVLRGDLQVRVEGVEYELGGGDLLAIGPGAAHALASGHGASVLLTVAFEAGHGGSGP